MVIRLCQSVLRSCPVHVCQFIVTVMFGVHVHSSSRSRTEEMLAALAAPLNSTNRRGETLAALPAVSSCAGPQRPPVPTATVVPSSARSPVDHRLLAPLARGLLAPPACASPAAASHVGRPARAGPQHHTRPRPANASRASPPAGRSPPPMRSSSAGLCRALQREKKGPAETEQRKGEAEGLPQWWGFAGRRSRDWWRPLVDFDTGDVVGVGYVRVRERGGMREWWCQRIR